MLKISAWYSSPCQPDASTTIIVPLTSLSFSLYLTPAFVFINYCLVNFLHRNNRLKIVLMDIYMSQEPDVNFIIFRYV